MSAALILVTLTPCVLMYLVHSLVLVTVDLQEMGSLVKVSVSSKWVLECDFASILDVVECTSNPCDTNAVCTDLLGSFTCTCNTGFSGDGFTCRSKLQLEF